MIRSQDSTTVWFDYTTNRPAILGCISTTSVQKSHRSSRSAEMGEINRRYFDNLMADHKLSLRALAARMGMGHSQLSLTFSGARKMTLDEASMISSIFSEPLERVVEAMGVETPPVIRHRAPVIGVMGGDGTVGIYGDDVIERTSAPDGLPPDVVAIQARTAGTPMEWMDGFVFFCRPLDGIDHSLYGAQCFVRVKDGPHAICTVKRGYRDRSVNLSGQYNAESVVIERGSPILLIRP